MNNKITVWFMMISMIWFTSCHKNRISKNTDKSVSDSVFVNRDSVYTDTSSLADTETETVAPVKIREIAFDYLTAKSKFSFQSKNQDFDNTNVNIRMKKDSLIWISVTGVGFELARGLITRDSIVFMDKFHKQYFVFSYEQLSRQYNFDLNFPLLQSVIIGNLPFKQQPDSEFQKESDFFVLKQKEGRINIENFVAESNLKLTHLNATETGTTNTFSLDYEDFKQVDSFLFPFMSFVKLNVKSPKDQQPSETTIRLKHSKVDIVSQSPGFPFNVPSGYKRKR
ncbi:DUF4292 domain-containing protein [Dyadobacter sp. NIV53]|uniref:DUF4292 domain-containing protein n=1 Tax=Dyadobacter sp. NIV53 TaxID=2861765 RepID=UPI001C86A3D9|nr:DUF4292 domain-containing protein [Dyadobacter sp. NIV53]